MSAPVSSTAEVIEQQSTMGPEALDVLFITFDGLLEPLGQSQVLSYLRPLTRRGFRISVLSFEKKADLANTKRLDELSAHLVSNGIQWTYLRFHRRPRALAKLYDLLHGMWVLTRMARRHEPSILHARSYVPATMAAVAKLFCNARLVFDIRGFWPEERVEMNLVRAGGFSYRLAKHLERFLFLCSDEIVALTQPSADIVSETLRTNNDPKDARRTPPVSIIPCCVDLDCFQPAEPDNELITRFNLRGRLLVGNVGSVNDRYLLHEMFRFTRHLKEHYPQLLFIYVTRQNPSPIYALAESAGLNQSDLLVASANPEDMPRWLSLLRLGVFFLRPSHAAKASSFTALGEFLACGIPVVTNTGIGDTDHIVGSTGAGLILSGLQENDLKAGATRASTLLDADRSKSIDLCRRVAEAHLSLDQGVESYRKIYERCRNAPSQTEIEPAAATESA